MHLNFTRLFFLEETLLGIISKAFEHFDLVSNEINSTVTDYGQKCTPIKNLFKKWKDLSQEKKLFEINSSIETLSFYNFTDRKRWINN